MRKIKIAYIGGGSRSWARIFMTDLAKEAEIGGTVFLYDIDFSASKDNEIIGNNIKHVSGATDNFSYIAVENINEALNGADFVIISILPGTLDEMESDVHTPEKYGIYQSVGDTVGPGGIVRTLRTVPQIREIALNIKKYCPNAWVINYTNPMSACVKALYKTFPDIKAFGCCHEVFHTQKLFWHILGKTGDWKDVKINVLGINHFTFINRATYNGENIMPIFDKFANEYIDCGYAENGQDWENDTFAYLNRVKFDLYKRMGIIPAAGDRHIAEFCPKEWYLQSPEQVRKWNFGLTTVAFRKKDRDEKLAKTKSLVVGREAFELAETGEEGVRLIKAIMGLGDYVTNANLPNRGQLEGFPMGAIVETNAKFSQDSVKPMYAGSMPKAVYALALNACVGQELSVEAGLSGDYDLAFNAFTSSSLVHLNFDDAKKLFMEMLEKTKKYLPYYENYIKQ